MEKVKLANKRKTQKKKITSEEKEKRAYRKDVREVFTRSGFIRIPKISDKQLEFKDVTGDFDDYFLFRNILVLTEYTIRSSSNISAHLKKKKILFDKVLEFKKRVCIVFD